MAFDPKYNALQAAKDQTLKLLQTAKSASTRRNLIKNLLDINKKIGVGGAGFTPLIKEGVTYVNESSVPLVKNLSQSRAATTGLGRNIQNLKGSASRLGKMANYQPKGANSMRIPGLGAGAAPAPVSSFHLGGTTSLAGLGAVVGAGYLGAKAIQSASKKTKRLQDKLSKESTQIADNLINVLKQRREQGLSNKDLMNRINRATSVR